MNKLFGNVHFVVTVLVLLHFCLDSVVGVGQAELVGWVMLVTGVLACYFSYQACDSDGGSLTCFGTWFMTILLAGQMLGGSPEVGGALWNVTTALYVVTTLVVGNRLRSG